MQNDIEMIFQNQNVRLKTYVMLWYGRSKYLDIVLFCEAETPWLGHHMQCPSISFTQPVLKLWPLGFIALTARSLTQNPYGRGFQQEMNYVHEGVVIR